MRFKPLSQSSSITLKGQSVSNKAYKDCFDLPLYNFIQASTTNDLKWLIISGIPGGLQELWMRIVAEYGELSHNEKFDQAFKLRKKIDLLKLKLDISALAMDGLARGYNATLVEVLQRIGFKLNFNNLEEDLKTCDKRRNNDKIALRIALADQEAAKLANTKNNTVADWNDEITELSKFQGYHIDEYTTSVAKYVSIRKAYNAYIKYLEKQVKDNK